MTTPNLAMDQISQIAKESKIASRRLLVANTSVKNQALLAITEE